MTTSPDRRHRIGARVTRPLVTLLIKMGVSPNALTWFGLLLGLGTAVLIGYGYLLIGGVMVLASGAFDMLDGAVARATGRITRYGGFLDSVVDRFSEAALMLGVLVFYLGTTAPAFFLLGREWSLLIVAVAIATAAWPSYLRARAEAAGINASAGFFTRPERVIVLAVGLFTGQPGVALGVIAALSLVTTAQRLYQASRAGTEE